MGVEHPADRMRPGVIGRVYQETWIEDHAISPLAQKNGHYSLATMLVKSLRRFDFDLAVRAGQTDRGFPRTTSVQVHGATRRDREAYKAARSSPEVKALVAALSPSVIQQPDVEACEDWDEPTRQQVLALKLSSIAASHVPVHKRSVGGHFRRDLAIEVKAEEIKMRGSLPELTERDLEKMIHAAVTKMY